MTKECTKCGGGFTWKQPYDGTKVPAGDKPCTCTPKVKNNQTIVEDVKAHSNEVDKFLEVWDDAWNAVYIKACKVTGEGSTALDKRICACGMMHDYFSFRANR